MNIVAQTESRLSWYDGYTGYCCINDMPIIFTNHSNLPLLPIPEKQGVFPMACRYEPPYVYDPEEWFFILKDDGYYRYNVGRGWMWFQDEI